MNNEEMIRDSLKNVMDGRAEDAIQRLESAIKGDDSSFSVKNNLACLYFNTGKFSKAAELLGELAEETPENSDVLNNYGYVLMQNGNLEEARNCLEKAREINPRDIDIVINLGLLHNYFGNTDRAIETFQEAIRMDGDVLEAHNNLGCLYRKKDMLEEARLEFEKAVALKEDDAEARNNLGCVLRAMGDYTSAVEQLEKAFELDENDDIVCYNLGVCCMLDKRKSEALKWFALHLEMNPESEYEEKVREWMENLQNSDQIFLRTNVMENKTSQKSGQKTEIRDYPNSYIREYLRKKVNIPVDIQIILDGEVFNKGTGAIENISPSGAYIGGLELEKDVFPARPFEVFIKVKDEKFSGIEGKCTPVRISHGEAFALGVEFDELNVVE